MSINVNKLEKIGSKSDVSSKKTLSDIERIEMKDVNNESKNIDVAKGKRILKNLTDSEESEVYYKALNEAYHDLTSCLRKPRYIDPSKFFFVNATQTTRS